MDLFLAAGATAVCLLAAIFALRSLPEKKSKPCGCACSCGGAEGGGGGGRGSMAKANGEVAGKGKEKEAVVADRQVGGSMMEQLVPEITTHALSYLDYPSLCRLSMTNSSMRRAANDDNAWKALYHKDFTVEQDSVTPPNERGRWQQ